MRVRRQSFGNKLINSFVAALLGILMFLGSFVVLYLNEGRENIGKIAREAKEITQGADVETDKLVCLNGKLQASNYAEDTYLTDSDYLLIERYVEMYAYVETKHTKEKDNLGGSTTITETFTYDLEWTSNPQKTTTFQGDNNELPNIPNETQYNTWIDDKPSSQIQKATDMYIGNYAVNESVTLSGKETLNLSSSNTDTSSLENTVVFGSYIYKSNEAEPNPQNLNFELGDIRISYKVIKAEKSGMIFGALNGDTLSAFVTPKNNSLFRYFSGVNSKSQAVAILEKEHKTMTWILRLVGFLLMFIGLMAMTGPVTKFLSVIPIFSKISGFIFGVIAFIVSLVLTTLTVVLSMILHNFWLAMAFVALIIIITILIIAAKRKKAQRA